MVSLASSGYELDEAKLITSSLDRKIRVIDLNNDGKVISDFSNPDGKANCLKMHNSSNFLLIADDSKKIKLWDINSGKIVSTFADSCGNKTCIENYDNDTFITSSSDGLLSMWDYRMTRKVLKSNVIKEKEIKGQPNCNINQILYTNGIIFTATNQGIVLVNSKTLGEQEYKRNHQGGVNSLVYSELDNMLFSSGFDKSVIVWDMK